MPTRAEISGAKLTLGIPTLSAKVCTMAVTIAKLIEYLVNHDEI